MNLKKKKKLEKRSGWILLSVVCYVCVIIITSSQIEKDVI